MATAVRALREKLGNEAMVGLQGFVDDAGRRWKDDVLVITGERFERRLGEEIGALRVDMAKEFAAVRVETAREFATIRVELRSELAATRVSLLKWSFLFWIGQFAAVSGMMAFLLRTIGQR
jgi:hypothetical protein